MENPEEVIEKRTNKIIKWLKNPYNFALFAIIVFAVAIRLYYFILTKTQPIWWDESEYLNIARSWAYGLEYNYWTPVRPVFFSLITAMFFKISYGEFLPRLLMLLLSIVSVIGMYYLGKEVYNKEVGLISSLFASVFYLNLFFTYRLQMDVPSLAFFILSALFFYKYVKNNSKHSSIYLSAVFLAIGTMFKQNTAFLLVAFLIFLLFTEKFNFLKKKEIWIALLIFSIILSPYLIWGYMKFGGFVLTQGQEEVAPEIIKIGYDNLKTYLIESPQYISRIFLIIFILGLVSFYKLFIGFDILIKNKDNNNELKRDLYVLLLLIIPIVLIGFLLNHPEPRYIMNGFPAVFMILGFIIFKGYVFIKQKSKLFAAICLIFLLCFFVYIQIFGAGYSDSLIKDKMNSYWEVREAGLWLADNSNPEDVIVTNSIHQIAYYANRNTIIPPANETVFEFMLQSNKTLKYLVVSLIQQSPDWAYTYPTEKKLEVANAYFADLEQQQPVLIIYKLGNQSTYS